MQTNVFSVGIRYLVEYSKEQHKNELGNKLSTGRDKQKIFGSPWNRVAILRIFIALSSGTDFR